MMTPVADNGLTSTDLDMAQQLEIYKRKITSLKKAGGEDPMLTSPKAERRNRKRRTRHLRSVAEDYRRARLAQRVVQAICGLQMLCTVLLAVMSSAGFAITLVGYGFGMAASFARVQKHHAICMVFNVAYGLVSFAMPVALLAELASSGSPEGLVRKLPKRHPLGVIVLGVVATIACFLGVLAAAYVIVRPLMLHRYESVAMDEKTADERTRKGKDGRPTLGLVEMALAPPAESEDEEDEEEGVRPMEAWLNAGELGVPLVFMPVPT